MPSLVAALRRQGCRPCAAGRADQVRSQPPRPASIAALRTKRHRLGWTTIIPKPPPAPDWHLSGRRCHRSHQHQWNTE